MALQTTLYLEPDPFLGHSHRLAFVQVGMRYVVMHYAYGLHISFGGSGEYMSLYGPFRLKLSLVFLCFILILTVC